MVDLPASFFPINAVKSPTEIRYSPEYPPKVLYNDRPEFHKPSITYRYRTASFLYFFAFLLFNQDLIMN